MESDSSYRHNSDEDDTIKMQELDQEEDKDMFEEAEKSGTVFIQKE